jgi:hypothetical protein
MHIIVPANSQAKVRVWRFCAFKAHAGRPGYSRFNQRRLVQEQEGLTGTKGKGAVLSEPGSILAIVCQNGRNDSGEISKVNPILRRCNAKLAPYCFGGGSDIPWALSPRVLGGQPHEFAWAVDSSRFLDSFRVLPFCMLLRR